jgi:hypothetical protein
MYVNTKKKPRLSSGRCLSLPRSLDDFEADLGVVLVGLESRAERHAEHVVHLRKTLRLLESMALEESSDSSVVTERALGVRSNDVVERGDHGERLVRQVVELHLQSNEPEPPLFVETRSEVGRHDVESAASISSVRGIHGTLRDDAEEITERLSLPDDLGLDGLEFGDFRLARRHVHLHGSKTAGSHVSEEIKLDRIPVGSIEREFIPELANEQVPGTLVLLRQRANPVPADRAELPPNQLDGVAVVLHLDENLSGV